MIQWELKDEMMMMVAAPLLLHVDPAIVILSVLLVPVRHVREAA
jgi:hypothetical protein